MLAWQVPARLDQLAALHGERPMPGRLWRALLAQLSLGPSLAVVDEHGAPVAALGLLPLGEAREALWFAASASASARIVGLTRLLRLTFSALCESRQVTILAYVAPGNRPIGRILASLGFTVSGRDHGFDRWERHCEGRI